MAATAPDVLPTGTVTFLFTDVEGSTRLWELHPAAMRRALARHDALIEQLTRRFRGRVVRPRGEGDSRFCVFARATDAVAAAGALQQAICAEPWPEETVLRIRIALHTGEADLRDGDYYGAAVNRCARLRAIAHGGQTLLSQALYDLVRDALPPGLSARDLGEQRLRDLVRPEHVYQLVSPDVPTAFPLLRSLDTLPTNLPLQSTSFVGREQELQAVRARLLQPDVRLLTLTGPGGTGKSRLALQVGADLLEDFADGVFLVSLAPISDAALVVSAIAKVLGVREESDLPLLEAVKDTLRPRHLLLVLDNFEQVLPAAPVLIELLAVCPQVRLLVTSREVLRLSAEHDFAVPPMRLPEPGSTPPLDEMRRFDAVRLFVERAQAARADCALSAENAPAVAEICARLDGLPLAIELAAARSRLLPPEAILSRLEHRLPLLTGGHRDLPARHQTLRAAIGWSHDLLDAPEQLLFCRLAVFVGGCTMDAAEAICNAAGDLGIDVLDGVESLVDKSLLRQEAVHGEPRLMMLETIREFGRDCLAARGELAALQQEHAAYYRAWVERAEPHLTGPDQAAWLAQLEAEHDNVRAALAWTADRDPAAALQLAAGLWRFWGQRGHLTEGRRWLRRTLEGAAEGEAAGRAARARALVGAGLLASFQGDHAEAATLLSSGLAAFREVGDTLGVALALRALGGCLLRSGGSTDQVRDVLEQSLRLAREAGDPRRVGGALVALGYLAARERDYAEARQRLTDGLALFRQVGDTRSIGATLWALGWLALEEGDTVQASRAFDEAMEIARQNESKQGVGFTLLGLAGLARATGDPDRARTLLEESVRQFLETGAPGVYDAISFLGELAVQRQEYARGVRLLAAGAAGQARSSSLSSLLFSIVQSEREATLTRARSSLGEAAFAALWTEGEAMCLEAAIEKALAASPPPESPGPAGTSGKHPQGAAAVPAPLTAREREVAALVARGLTNRQIAQALIVTEGTAASHVEHIRDKLGFRSRAQIAAWATEHRGPDAWAPHPETP